MTPATTLRAARWLVFAHGTQSPIGAAMLRMLRGDASVALPATDAPFADIVDALDRAIEAADLAELTTATGALAP